MTRDLLLVAGHGRHRTLATVHRQAVDAVSHERVIDPMGRDADAVVAPEVPRDPVGPVGVVGETQVDDLVLDRLRGSELVVLRTRPAVYESFLAAALVGVQPFVVALPRDSEVPAGLGDIAALPRMLQDLHLAPDVVLSLSHLRPPVDGTTIPLRQARSGISKLHGAGPRRLLLPFVHLPPAHLLQVGAQVDL